MSIRKAYLDLPQGQVHYRTSAGPGLPLVFLHRTPASSASFTNMMSLMAGERALYALDTPGFGQSFDPEGMPAMTDYAGWALAALDALGIGDCVLFGHHTGVHIATQMAVMAPERVRALIINGIAYFTAEEREGFRQKISAPLPPDPEGDYVSATWKIISGLFTTFDPVLTHQEFLDALRATEGRRQSFAAVCDQDYPAVLAQVTCPILALTAEDDIFRAFFDRLLADRPDAAHRILGPAGICSPERDAEGNVAAVREFLQKAVP